MFEMHRPVGLHNSVGGRRRCGSSHDQNDGREQSASDVFCGCDVVVNQSTTTVVTQRNTNNGRIRVCTVSQCVRAQAAEPSGQVG